MVFSSLTTRNSDDCYALHSSSQFNPWSKAVFNDCLSPPYFAYQLFHNDSLMGYYIALKVLDEVTLMDIAVQTKYRGEGWGKKLLSDFILQCKSHNVSDIWLEVRESNMGAYYLYLDAGFAVIEKRKNYYQTKDGKEHAIIMRLTLVNLPRSTQ